MTPNTYCTPTVQRLFQGALLAMTLIVCLGSVQAEVLRLSDPISSDPGSETFGAPLPDAMELKTLAEVLDKPARFTGKQLLVTAQVDQVCQKKGCFFIASDGDAMVRVSFKDYGFFVPTDIAGRRVTLAGEFTTRELSAEEAQHYASDLGSPAPVIEAGLIYEIVASAVRVPKT